MPSAPATSARRKRHPSASGTTWRAAELARAVPGATANNDSAAARLENELVARAIDRDDVLGFGGVLLDLLAQLHDEVVDAAGRRVARDAPDLLEELLARDG